VYINGTPLKSDKYGKESIKDAGLASVPQTLAQDEYFVLGDNRNMSTDSRNEIVGLVKRKDIVGKAVFRILPFGEFGGLN
jgi:signal peptidase I